ncbi:MAG: hypothetical protein WAO19_03975 [Candidatus Kryptoniota bacterium]
MKKLLFVFFLSIAIAACQKADNVVIDSSPLISAQLTYFDKDSIDIAAYIGTKNLPTISDSFQVTISSSDRFSHLAVMVQNDSSITLTEVSFSTLVGNSISGKFSFSPTSVYVSNLTYTFTAYNSDGTPGNYATKSVRLFNSAVIPPVIDSVIVPDSVQIPLSTATDTVETFALYAVVHDPAGLSDVEKVYFNVTKPDGTPSTGNPFSMYDDGGASGAPGDVDLYANDGIYTLGISLYPSNALGIYKFTFYAVNRSGVTSAPVSHNIKVYQ